MAGLKCNHCGNAIRYHGEPNGTELIMFTSKTWKAITDSVYDPTNEVFHTEYVIPSPYLYQADTICSDFKGQFCKIWKCPHCGTLHIFDMINTCEVVAVYIKCEYSENSIENVSQEYVIFDDIIWDKITELSIPNMELPNLFKPSFYASVNKEYLLLYVDSIEKATYYIKEEHNKE